MLGKLILDAKPVVVPARVFGAEKILGSKNKWPNPFSKIIIKYGPPINLEKFYSTGENTKEVSQKIIDAVMESIATIE